MKTIHVTEKDVKAAFDVAKSEEMKNVLAALFCKSESEQENVPSLDDYKTIKTYEDACEALNEKPWLSQNPMACWDDTAESTAYDAIPAHIVTLMKLETISKALWGRKFQPQPDASGDKWYYYPWFALYTQKEMDDMSEEDRGALLSAYAGDGSYAGFGYLDTDGRSSCAFATFGFRLCQETSEKAAYFGKQFINLWAEYLKFNFEIQPK